MIYVYTQKSIYIYVYINKYIMYIAIRVYKANICVHVMYLHIYITSVRSVSSSTRSFSQVFHISQKSASCSMCYTKWQYSQFLRNFIVSWYLRYLSVCFSTQILTSQHAPMFVMQKMTAELNSVLKFFFFWRNSEKTSSNFKSSRYYIFKAKDMTAKLISIFRNFTRNNQCHRYDDAMSNFSKVGCIVTLYSKLGS